MSDSLGRRWRACFCLLLMGIFAGLTLPAFGQNSLPDKASKAPFSQLKVKPTSLSFAKVNFQKGPASSDKSLLVSNSGTEALTVTVGSPATAAFSVIAGAGPATLDEGKSETVTVEFVPAAAGSFSGAIAINSNATKGLADVTLKLKGSAVGTIPLPPGISGNVSGGQSPITTASVSLYAMSYTGYGTAPSQLAATTSDASGKFSFLSFTCPAGNPETYIVALGGDAGSGGNSAIGLMAALGPCASLSSPTAVTVNELTTVAAEWGLAQFSDPTGQNFGTSSTNPTGLANAVAQITSDLISSATGEPAAFFPAAAHCSGSSPPANCDGLERLDTDANILAACIESSGPASSACDALLNATGSGATTLQAAHVIATDPTEDFSALFALQSGSPPFTPALSTAPASWEIALNFTPSGAKFKNPNRVAIDAAGDIWILNYSG
ncbi:MAG: choice-of-anchor D domain-containing protein, partial [Candidatus Binataceae bacterium]